MSLSGWGGHSPFPVPSMLLPRGDKWTGAPDLQLVAFSPGGALTGPTRLQPGSAAEGRVWLSQEGRAPGPSTISTTYLQYLEGPRERWGPWPPSHSTES